VNALPPYRANESTQLPCRRDEQLATLQARLVSLQAQPVTRAQQIAHLEHADKSTRDAAQPSGESATLDLIASTVTK